MNRNSSATWTPTETGLYQIRCAVANDDGDYSEYAACSFVVLPAGALIRADIGNIYVGDSLGELKVAASAPSDPEPAEAQESRNKEDEQDDFLLGDVDLNGVVSTDDAVCVGSYDAGYLSLTDEKMTAADVNLDGNVTIADAVRIVRFVAGDIDTLAPGEAVADATTTIMMDGVAATEGDVKTLTVTVALPNGTEIAGASVKLRYDTSVLTIHDVQDGAYELNNLNTSSEGLVVGNFYGREASSVGGVLYTVVFDVTEGKSISESSVWIDGMSSISSGDGVYVAWEASVNVAYDYVLGDFNGDGDVTILDVLALLKHVAGISTLNGNLDVNKDGSVTIIDVLHLLKFVARIITSL